MFILLFLIILNYAQLTFFCAEPTFFYAELTVLCALLQLSLSLRIEDILLLI